MNLIHCLRLVLNNIVAFLSTSKSLSVAASPTGSSQGSAVYAASPPQRAAPCAHRCTRFWQRLRLQAHSKIRVKATTHNRDSGAQMKSAEILPKYLCLFLID